MRLSIYSLQNTLFDGEVDHVTIPTATGEITVLPNHLPLISVVTPGEIRYSDAKNYESTLSLGGGIVEVRPGSEVVILADERSL